MNHPTPIIIKKKRAAHAGHHGGAWKVAYADFVTAMMAFFLVMWLVAQNKPVKQAVAGYFRDPGVFETTRSKGMLDGGKGIENAVDPTQEDAQRLALETAVSEIRDRLNQVPELKTLRDQIEYTITAEGLRIDLLEADKSSFFDSGKAVLRSETVRILGIIARELGKLENEVIIDGHTDRAQFARTDGYTNWELSADRANAARHAMERQGLRTAQITSIRGHADRQPRLVDNPFDARNRRISILVKSTTTREYQASATLVDSIDAAAKGVTPAVKSAAPAVHNATPAVHGATPAVKSATTAMKTTAALHTAGTDTPAAAQ